MRKAKIFYKGEEAGMLIQHDNGSFTYKYTDLWMADQKKPSISLTLPKTAQEHHAEYLFPFFFNMLPEGTNKKIVCRLERLDKEDYFGLLLTTAKYDTIGAITVHKTE
ncbi:HipA N-terminal domain-containing protein [Catalinimonas sp. 4WD22]|uniref:HipA N-terminal domain-containing protein n=1 Tax=Catalinimonas locisalis TaxID=3133978 RepID=UPI00310119A1